jgi:hypothetical protein
VVIRLLQLKKAPAKHHFCMTFAGGRVKVHSNRHF